MDRLGLLLWALKTLDILPSRYHLFVVQQFLSLPITPPPPPSAPTVLENPEGRCGVSCILELPSLIESLVREGLTQY